MLLEVALEKLEQSALPNGQANPITIAPTAPTSNAQDQPTSPPRSPHARQGCAVRDSEPSELAPALGMPLVRRETFVIEPTHHPNHASPPPPPRGEDSPETASSSPRRETFVIPAPGVRASPAWSARPAAALAILEEGPGSVPMVLPQTPPTGQTEQPSRRKGATSVAKSVTPDTASIPLAAAHPTPSGACAAGGVVDAPTEDASDATAVRPKQAAGGVSFTVSLGSSKSVAKSALPKRSGLHRPSPVTGGSPSRSPAKTAVKAAPGSVSRSTIPSPRKSSLPRSSPRPSGVLPRR